MRYVKSKGLLVILSGPSASGKGTLINEFLKQKDDISLSISATTRMPRDGETDGIHYFFWSREKFESEIANDGLLEYDFHFDNYYGTPKEFVLDKLKTGNDVILEIEIKGARQVKKRFKDAVTVFVIPPTPEELKNRMKKRGSESEKQIEDRLKRATEEISSIDEYDYFIINDNLKDAVKRLESIITSEKNRVVRHIGEIKEIWREI